MLSCNRERSGPPAQYLITQIEKRESHGCSAAVALAAGQPLHITPTPRSDRTFHERTRHRPMSSPARNSPGNPLASSSMPQGVSDDRCRPSPPSFNLAETPFGLQRESPGTYRRGEKSLHIAHECRCQAIPMWAPPSPRPCRDELLAAPSARSRPLEDRHSLSRSRFLKRFMW